MSREGSDDSGMVVYPPLPVPKQGRGSDAAIRKSSGNIRGASWKQRLALGGAIALAGAAAGFALRPRIAPDARLDELAAQLAAQTQAVASSRAHADELQGDLDKAAVARTDLEARLKVADVAKAQLADQAAATDQSVHALGALAEELRGAVDKAIGSVTVEGADVRVAIVDKTLWKPGDDALTDKGKAILDKLAVALHEVGDKQIEVAGNTDDAPLPAPPPPPKHPPKGPPPPAPVARFATSWELSAARALAVVHYLQDAGKLDPERLGALAYGQYHPASRTNRALNRRLEIIVRAR